MKKEKTQNNEGITLIALVITIIVLLILAGVTINLTLGEKGIFSTAKQAAKNYTNAQDRELVGLDNFMNEINNTIEGEYANSEVLSGKWNSTMKVNSPNIVETGLRPVTIGTDGTITEVSETAKWYNYNTTKVNEIAAKTWANAKTEDGSLWVWIPRYAYKLDESNKTIDVVFLKDTGLEPATDTTANGVDSKNITIKRATDEELTDSDYIVHPAFTNEKSSGYSNGGWKKELPGFWVAKFEAGYAGDKTGKGTTESGILYTTETTDYYGAVTANTTKIKYPVFQANRPSFYNITIGDSWNISRHLTDENNPYGFSASKVDTHMMKNSEWGAVAYLSYSDYGQGKATEVAINSAYAQGTDNVLAVTGYGNTSETTLSNLLSGEAECNWKSPEGQKASTTGNISGIYDMRGGVWEMTAGYLKNGSSSYGDAMIKSSGSTITSSNEYVDVYNGYSDTTDQKRVGEAIWETSIDGSGANSWNEDFSNFPSTEPFFRRGGYYGDGSGAGVFTFTSTSGTLSVSGFRPVVVPSV